MFKHIWTPFTRISIVLLCIIANLETLTAHSPVPDPYNIDNNTVLLSNIGAATVFFTGTYLYLTAGPNSAEDLSVLDPTRVPFYDRVALGNVSAAADVASDILLVSLMAEAAVINLRHPSALRPLESPFLPTFGTSMGLNAMIKSTARRFRPYAYDTTATGEVLADPDASLSFYSGHTSGAFTAAVYSSMMYEMLGYPSSGRGWVWAVNMTAATATGVLRVGAGKHFPSDVVVGAVLGSAIGWFFPKLYSLNTEDEHINNSHNNNAGLDASSIMPSTVIYTITIPF